MPAGEDTTGSISHLLTRPFISRVELNADSALADSLIAALNEPVAIWPLEQPAVSAGADAPPPDGFRTVLLDLGSVRLNLTGVLIRGETTAARRKAIGRAVSVLRRTLAILVYIDHLIASANWAYSSLDHLPYGVFRIEPSGRCSANAAGRRLVAAGDGISTGRDGLFARHQADARLLRAALDRARGVNGIRPKETLLTLQRSGNLLQLNALVLPVFYRSNEGWVPSGRVILFIADPHRTHAPGLGDRLRIIFALTPSEARIVEALIDGKRLDEVAAMMGNSVETVRAHLRHIFDKVGVHRQSDLIRITMTSVSVLAPDPKI